MKLKYLALKIIFLFIGLNLNAHDKPSNSHYLEYINVCSNELDFVVPFVPVTKKFSLDIFIGKKINKECLVEKFSKYHLSHQLKTWTDEIIKIKEITTSNNIEDNVFSITSLDKFICVESCKITSDYILEDDEYFYYISDGSTDYGIEAKFINENNIWIKRNNSTHTGNVLFNTKKLAYEDFGSGKIVFLEDFYGKYFMKRYTSWTDDNTEIQSDGPFWWSAIYDYEHNLVELINYDEEDGKECLKRDYFEKWNSNDIFIHMILKDIDEFCVFRK